MEVIAPACHQKKIPPSGNTNRAGNRILSDTRNTALDEKKKNAEMGKKRCEHGREPSRCKDCGGSGLCEHGRPRSKCKDCGGSGICEHGRMRSVCKDCGGGGRCEHGRERRFCKDCGGSGLCEQHGRRDRPLQARTAAGGSGICLRARAGAQPVQGLPLREGRSGYAGEGSGCARGCGRTRGRARRQAAAAAGYIECTAAAEPGS